MKKIERILLIDDDEINNFINLKLLNRLNIAEEIKILKNGFEALNHLKNQCILNGKICPGLVFLDHHMPVMDGMEMMQEFNKIPITNRNDIVFILLGANSSKADFALFKNLGVEEFTEKPLEEEVVLNAYNKYWKQ